MEGTGPIRIRRESVARPMEIYCLRLPPELVCDCPEVYSVCRLETGHTFPPEAEQSLPSLVLPRGARTPRHPSYVRDNRHFHLQRTELR